MLLKNIPDDINAELLLSYFPEGTCKVVLKGLHKRNTYRDIMEFEERRDGTLLLGLGRNSLYNSLPEFLFHPVDRFDNIPQREEKEKFAEEYQKQEQEKEDAYRFFAPIDMLLLKLRVDVRKGIEKYVIDDRFLIDIMGDRLSEEQKSNRFIGQALRFIPHYKVIRGNKTLLTFMLRKIFMEEGLKIERHHQLVTYSDANPRYSDGLGSSIEGSYVGNVFDEETTIYDIRYWSEDECNEDFMKFIEEVGIFRMFVQDYLLSIEESIHFNICKDEEPLRLSDNIVFNYLNYNTNL